MLELLEILSPGTWLGIIIVIYLLFKGLKSLILASKGVDDDH